MQLFAEGKDTGWGKISYKVEYETKREGPKLGIKWKLSWGIQNNYYFGFNILADIWTEGKNYGRQVKDNIPNKGKGFIETEWLWFDKGYGANSIERCRITFKSTTGGNVSFDTGPDRAVSAPQGYAVSTIMYAPNFTVGQNVNVQISDITNQNYLYKVGLYVKKEDDTYENIAYLETTSKNFTIDISAKESHILGLLSTRKSSGTQLILQTHINEVYLGSVALDGTVILPTNYIPDLLDSRILNSNLEEISGLSAGFGPYNDGSNIYVRIPKYSEIPEKYGSKLKNIIINAGVGGTQQHADIPASQLLITTRGGGFDESYYYEPFIDPFGALQDNELNNGTGEVVITLIDERGCCNILKKSLTIDFIYREPKILEIYAKRKNAIDTETNLYFEGVQSIAEINDFRMAEYYIYNNYPDRNNDEIPLGPFNILDKIQYNAEKFTLNTLIQGDLGAIGFTKNKQFYIKLKLVDRFNAHIYMTVKIKNGKPLMYYGKNGVAFGEKYDENVGGPLQIDGIKYSARNSISVYKNEKVFALPQGDSELNFDAIKEKTGDSFNLANGKVVFNKDVSRFVILCQAWISSFERTWLRLYLNNELIADSITKDISAYAKHTIITPTLNAQSGDSLKLIIICEGVDASLNFGSDSELSTFLSIYEV